MVILKSKNEELHRFFPLPAKAKSQATSFAAYEWTTRPSLFFPVLTHRILHISLNTQWLRIMVSLRRMEPSDFMSVLAR